MTPLFLVSYAIYCVLIELVVWCVLVPVTLLRILAGHASWGELRQRLGFDAADVCGGYLLHGVSAGEMRAASTLVSAWRERPLLLTTRTSAGMTIAARIAAYEARVKAAVYMPWDRRAIRSWLRATGISAVIVTEAEVWPCLFLACRALNVPLFIVNGQIDTGATRRYRLARWFFEPVLACVSWIGTRDAGAREAYLAIGAARARVEVAGNLKADARPDRRQPPDVIASHLERGPIIVAGSTHDPEESWLVDQLELLLRMRAARLVIAPRDIRRAGCIRRIAARYGLHCAHWSALDDPGAMRNSCDAWHILVVDTFGWLPSLYRYADVVFLGGTVSPVGGHNIIEPALAAKPIIVGPHTEAIGEMTSLLRSGGGVIEIDKPFHEFPLRAACAALLDNPERAREIGAAASRICAALSGAVERYDRAITQRMAS